MLCLRLCILVTGYSAFFSFCWCGHCAPSSKCCRHNNFCSLPDISASSISAELAHSLHECCVYDLWNMLLRTSSCSPSASAALASPSSECSVHDPGHSLPVTQLPSLSAEPVHEIMSLVSPCKQQFPTSSAECTLLDKTSSSQGACGSVKSTPTKCVYK